MMDWLLDFAREARAIGWPANLLLAAALLCFLLAAVLGWDRRRG